MNDVLLDTDILINFLKGKEKARNFLLSLLDDSVLLCSAITVAEIYAGMKDHERNKTEDLIASLSIVNVDREIAEKAGAYKNTTKSQSLELDDCIIAATAAVRKAVLATSNSKHYPMSDINKVTVKAD